MYKLLIIPLLYLTISLPISAHPSSISGVKATGYSWREKAHHAYGELNCLGGSLRDTVEGCQQIAADSDFLPVGSIVQATGIGKRIVTDCGSAVHGKHIDVHFDSLADMENWGTRLIDLQVVRWGWGDNHGKVAHTEEASKDTALKHAFIKNRTNLKT